MKLRKELLFLLLVMSVASESEVPKKQSETSDEEAEEDVSLEEYEFEHLRELEALHNTILKMVPSNEPYLTEKITKKKEEVDSEPKTKEEGSTMTNVWMKAMMAHIKNIDLSNINFKLEKEDTETWTEEEQLEPLSEETQEPLSPMQQEGILIKVVK